MVSHPSRYPHSSYQFYAYGKKNSYTKYLTPPPAYLALGDTVEARRKRYRQMCDAYLKEKGLIDNKPSEEVQPPVAVEQTALRLVEITPNSTVRSRGDP